MDYYRLLQRDHLIDYFVEKFVWFDCAVEVSSDGCL